jgi:transcriptional regulator with XRE-family HTH domain
VARGLTTLTGGQGARAMGLISGFVLKLARQSAALTQDKFAEALGVDVTTVQGWESGRRPISAISAGDFLRLCGRPPRLGAPAATGRHLREAVEADHVLATGITAGNAWVNPDSHPLAASVHRWTSTNLILWPILGRTPQHLHEFVPRVPRRGPALIASRPSLLSGPPAIRASLAAAIDRLASTTLARTERSQVAGLQYAIRIADR